MAEYGRAQYRLGQYRGFIDGYVRAKRDAIEELTSKVAAPPVPPKAVQPPPSPSVTVRLAPTTQTDLQVMDFSDVVVGAKDLVLNAVKVFPGRRGSELLREIRKTGSQLHERTLRTILFRNKVPQGQRPKDGQLVSVDRRWYIYPDVPDGYQHELQTEGAVAPPLPKADGGQR